jgi:hypothetical protein
MFTLSMIMTPDRRLYQHCQSHSENSGEKKTTEHKRIKEEPNKKKEITKMIL